MKKINIQRLLIFSSLFLLIIGIAISIMLFKNQLDSIATVPKQKYEGYDRHYAFISRYREDEMQKEIYQGAYEYGKNSGALVEWLGISLDKSYSDTDLMKMAISSKVDGIILFGDDSKELRELINQASENDIPVITTLNDSYGSARQSYVGISNYNLGREYGREIIKFATKDTREVLILADSSIDANSQSVILNGIKETLNNEGNHLKIDISMQEIDTNSAFSSDNEIRALLKSMNNKYPDAVIALSQKNTNSLYQAVIDMNIVGKLEILGFYTSKAILEEVQKKVITASVDVDFVKMGETSVQALNEYLDTGFVSDFFLIDSKIVNSSNVEEYLKNERD